MTNFSTNDPDKDCGEDANDVPPEESLKRWMAETDATLRRYQAEQDFVKAMIDRMYEADRFRLAPDRDDLNLVAELGVRLAFTCYKQHGCGSWRGFGIEEKFMDAARSARRDGKLSETRKRIVEDARVMKLNQALETLADHYRASVKDNGVARLAPIQGEITMDVWRAWNVVLRRIGRIK